VIAVAFVFVFSFVDRIIVAVGSATPAQPVFRFLMDSRSSDQARHVKLERHTPMPLAWSRAAVALVLSPVPLPKKESKRALSDLRRIFAIELHFRFESGLHP
jgi:hypothetical protein